MCEPMGHITHSQRVNAVLNTPTWMLPYRASTIACTLAGADSARLPSTDRRLLAPLRVATKSPAACTCSHRRHCPASAAQSDSFNSAGRSWGEIPPRSHSSSAKPGLTPLRTKSHDMQLDRALVKAAGATPPCLEGSREAVRHRARPRPARTLSLLNICVSGAHGCTPVVVGLLGAGRQLRHLGRQLVPPADLSMRGLGEHPQHLTVQAFISIWRAAPGPGAWRTCGCRPAAQCPR